MNFKQIGIEDYGILKPFFFNQAHRLSVYSLLSIIVWSGQKYRASYAVRDGAVIIGNESTTDPRDRYLTLPVGRKPYPGPEALRALAGELDYPEYWFVPADYFSAYKKEDVERLFTVAEQTEYEDYIYLTEDLSHLKGNRFAQKRNHINWFRDNYENRGLVSVEGITGKNSGDCLAFLEEWCRDHDGCHGIGNDDLACEKRALVTALNNVDALEGAGLLVRIEGTVSALGLASRLNATMGVLNFEKAFPRIRGLYQFLDRECAKLLFRDYTYINKESDMGIPELAQSKRSYNPVEGLKSYKLAVRQSEA